jgi:very-short-patch-repair endonuclease
MNFDNDFIMQNNARLLSSFKFQPRYKPMQKEERSDEPRHPEKIRLSADERRFLLSTWTYQYKLTLTEIYSVVGFSASKGTRITKKLEREFMIKIFNIVKGKGVSKYPVLLADCYKILDIEERKFEGKGCGYEHLIWQHILTGHFKEYKAVIELNRGNKCIDVAFEYQGRLIAIEVAITSAHEKENIEKDINLARAGIVIIGCRDEKVLNEVNAIISELSGDLKIKARGFILSRILSMNIEDLVNR